MILKILKLHSPKGSCNFENFQNHSYLLITNCDRGRAISDTNSLPCSVRIICILETKTDTGTIFPVWETEKHWGNMRAMNVSGKMLSRFADVNCN